MTIQDLKAIYAQDHRSEEISDQLRAAGSKVHLKGLVGSSLALIASEVIEANAGVHVFILNDKEEAIYVLNDLENLNQGEFKPLFYPRSARVPYQVEKTENANISMRAEVLDRKSVV